MSIFGNNRKTGKSPEKFFQECLEEFLNETVKAGYGKHHVSIPELVVVGKDVVLQFLQDSYFQMAFGNNPAQYYYVINSLCLQAGVVLAAKWHENFKGMDDMKNYAKKIIAEGPAETAKPIFRKQFDLDSDGDAGEKLYSKVFDKWLELHEPYWELRDARQYTFNAMLASFQTGVSLLLASLGY